MHSVAVILCDNDFGNTFVPLLETVYRAVQHRGIGNVTPEYVERIIREGVRFHYMAFQGPTTPRCDQDSTPYLLKNLRVLFDEEADTATITDNDGGSWYLMLNEGTVLRF